MSDKVGKFFDDKESWLMRKADWSGKSIDEESQLMRKVDWEGKLIDKTSWLTREVDWWGMSIISLVKLLSWLKRKQITL